jgi:subtilase family serine protease
MFNRFGAHFACAIAVILMIGSPGSSQMASKDRILRPVDPSQTALVPGTAHPLARPEFDQGRVSPDRPITGTLVFRLSATQQTDLDRLLQAQQKPSSPSYHQWLTPEQYADRFGMSQNDLAKVSAWLKSQGLTVNGISRGRTELYFSGQVGAVENAFRTEIHQYAVNGKVHFANATGISVPQSFGDVVLGVRGLDNFRPKPMSRFHTMSASGASPRFTSSISGNHFLNPADFAVIYDVLALYNAGFDGTGVKIAVIGQSEILATGNATTDLDAFRTSAGLPTKDPAFTLVPSTGSATFNSGDAVEADLDLEWSNAVAKNADVTFVFSGNTGNAFDAISFAVNQGLSSYQIISNSFGLCESDIGQAQADSLWQLVRQATSQGQTMTSATGDTGAADCDGDQANVPASASKGLSVDVPAAIPEVTGVGGTEFMGDAAGTVSGTAPNTCAAATPFWLASPGTPPACDLSSPEATAISYIPEMAWNDTTQDKRLSAGGGGASTFFAKPTWQSGAGVPADGARDVPDIALNASADHDPYLICSQAAFAGSKTPLTSCANPTTDGFRASDNQSLSTVGGTSAGAPTFAGILALIIQATGAKGLGNVNPMLYSLATNSPLAFNDITSGSNAVPCVVATTDCPVGTTTIGFSAGPGYDQATGLGSVDANQLEAAWAAALAAPKADFLMDAHNGTAAPPQTGMATINITATNGFADTVNLTCAPSSAATAAQITCSLNPTSVVLSSSTNSGTSTLSLTTVAALEKPRMRSPHGTWLAATGGLFAAVLLGGIPSRRRWYSLFALVLLATGIGASGCGGGGSSPPPTQKAQGTPAGTYAITVTGTGMATGATHSTTVTLFVQ